MNEVATVPAPGQATGGKVRAFSFGSPEPVLDRRDIYGMLECVSTGRWYEPPVPMSGLARAFRVAPHHSSAILVKRNLLLSTFRPTPLMSRTVFSKWALDFLTMGNGYIVNRPNVLGRPLTLEHSLALYTRVGVKRDTHWFVTDSRQPYEYGEGRVFHLFEPDVAQEIYGLPEYMSAMQPMLLNEAATLFRRKYYQNGSHAGFILYSTDEGMDDETWETVEETLGEAKGAGNFKNVLLHVPGGKKDGLVLIPVAEVAAKDEFLGIKNTTRDDMLAAHRVPPQLLGVVPANAGGFGDVEKAARIFFRNEIVALQQRFLELNDWLGAIAVQFDPYEDPAIAA